MDKSLSEITRRIRSCKKCRLHKCGRNAVPGEGPPDAGVMLVGQNPGRKEDETGRPFVGMAGAYLDKVLKRNGIDRERLFITSVVKHKTPGNRKPGEDEIRACVPWLKEQIDALGPDIIVLMGKVAKETARREGIDYIETCHPAAAMRFPKMRAVFEQGISRLKDELERRPL